MIQVSAKSETVVTEALESELQNWVQVDLINRGQWLAVTTERSTAEEVNEADSAAEKPGDETNERTNESQPGTSP